MPTATELVEPLALMFEDDGSIPNNPRLPLLIYRNAIDIAGTPDRESVIEAVFAEHGWGEMWRNGIHPYAHYHSSIHEALGIARGRAMRTRLLKIWTTKTTIAIVTPMTTHSIRSFPSAADSKIRARRV